eukprot:jgi/Mesen1/6409/ME000329S05573
MAAIMTTIRAPSMLRAPAGLARSAAKSSVATMCLPKHTSLALKNQYNGLYGGPSLSPAAASISSKNKFSRMPVRSMTTASLSVGTKLPEADLSYFDKEGNLQTVSISQLTKGKKVVLFAVPGAFTPTCSQKHLPGFIEKADELTSKGVDTIACVAVNDAFVMRAWGDSVGATEKVLMLADGSGLFTKALGVALDLTDKGLGIRSRRYALLADDGVVKILNLEEGGAFTTSGPDEILASL